MKSWPGQEKKLMYRKTATPDMHSYAPTSNNNKQ